MWRIVPAEWRFWWIRDVSECIPLLRHVTVQDPAPIFFDVTDKRDDFYHGIGSMRASQLRRVCNEHLMPVVRCPWGCSEYYHKSGLLAFDSVVRKIFGSAVRPMFGGEKRSRREMSAMEGLNRDYYDSRGTPCLLGNKKWRVVPSVAFVDGMPHVLSCRSHGHGSTGKCFHPPRNPH